MSQQQLSAKRQQGSRICEYLLWTTADPFHRASNTILQLQGEPPGHRPENRRSRARSRRTQVSPFASIFIVKHHHHPCGVSPPIGTLCIFFSHYWPSDQPTLTATTTIPLQDIAPLHPHARANLHILVPASRPQHRAVTLQCHAIMDHAPRLCIDFRNASFPR